MFINYKYQLWLQQGALKEDFDKYSKQYGNLFYPFQLLTRVFDTMRAKNPDVVAGEKKKFVMRPPQVFKIGTKKTSFANFGDICKM